MCGIVGIRRFDGTPVAEEDLRAMAARLPHRGPDGEGYWVGGTVGFGHRRLAVIDPTGSPQPMASLDGLCHIAFNGEILNYRELRSTLGSRFRTHGDTEVLLASYRAWGAGSVRRLRGQFAYAVHDARDDRLWLVRDRLGILPLYYYADDRMVLFASEVKALLAALPGPPEVDRDSLGDYLTGRAVPAPHTLFHGVRKLRPGHTLRVDPDGRCVEEPYWSLSELEPGPSRRRPAEAAALLADALEASVAEALVADVPVGAYLSGGVDSSLIVALMSRARDGAGVETFSAGFGDLRVDELAAARRVSRHLGTRHHEVVVTPADFEALWPLLTWHRDAPLSEPADVAVFRLAQAARQRVTVVLSGEGSDELFAGYPKYRAARLAAAADLVPDRLRRSTAGAVERWLPGMPRRLRVGLRALGAAPDERFSAWFSPFSADERVRLLGAQPRPWQPEARAAARGDVVRRMLQVDCAGWLADNLLERGDRMSMAASLELRPPFLDHRVVELAFSLPTSVKLRHGHGKWVVKAVAERFLPAEIVHRPKSGFRVPLDGWFRTSLRDLARDRLLDPASFVTEVFDRPTVERLLDRHDQGRSDEHVAIWTLLSLETWHDVFFGPDRLAFTPAAAVPAWTEAA